MAVIDKLTVLNLRQAEHGLFSYLPWTDEYSLRPSPDRWNGSNARGTNVTLRRLLSVDVATGTRQRKAPKARSSRVRTEGGHSRMDALSKHSRRHARVC